QRLDALAGTVRRLATLLDARACGDSLLAALRAGLDSVRVAYAKGDPVDVAFAVWHAPASVAGGDTYVDDVIRAAGGRNAFGDVSGWPEISAEALIARDPDVIIVPAGGGSSLRPEWLRSAPRWRALRAVREGRVIVVDADLFERPGTRVVDAAGTLARALHTGRARWSGRSLSSGCSWAGTGTRRRRRRPSCAVVSSMALRDSRWRACTWS